MMEIGQDLQRPPLRPGRIAAVLQKELAGAVEESLYAGIERIEGLAQTQGMELFTPLLQPM